MPLLKHKWTRWVIGGLAVTALAMTYIFQRYDFSALAGSYSPNGKFIINRLVRFILNDSACLLLIMAVFNKATYLRLSTWVFAAELFILLPLYFLVKLTLEGGSEISSPLLSQFHRMIVNPLLMIVLMMGFVYQDYFWARTRNS